MVGAAPPDQGNGNGNVVRTCETDAWVRCVRVMSCRVAVPERASGWLASGCSSIYGFEAAGWGGMRWPQ